MQLFNITQDKVRIWSIYQVVICLTFQMTPDRDIIIDFHPQCKNIVIGAGMSGNYYSGTQQEHNAD